MRAPILIVLTSALAVLLVGASALLKRRKRLAHGGQPTAILRTALLSDPEINESGWWFGLLSPLLLVACTAALLKLRWDTLPERLPIHWGISGQPNLWASRSFTSVFGILLLNLALLAGLGLLGELIARSSPGHEGRSAMIRTIRMILVMCSWFVTTLTCLVSLLPLSHNPANLVLLMMMAAAVFSLGVAGYIVIWVFRMERIMIAGQNSTDGRYWRAGVFCFNPEDSALVVPKQSGFGYTLNFGRPVCWLIFALILSVPLMLPLLLLRSHEAKLF